MKRDTINYVMVGGFVVAMGAAFAILLFAITGRSGPSDSYYVYYDNVSGLKFGTGVFYEGYHVGQIEDIVPEATDDGMRYRVELSISSGWKIPADSVASVEASGLISAVTIQISEGTSSEMLSPGDTIQGRGQADLLATLSEAASDFRVLSQNGILPVLQNVNQRITQLADEITAFRREELSPLVQMMHRRLDEEVFTDAHELLEHLDESAQGLRAMVDAGNQKRVADFLEHVDDVALNLNGLVDRIETTRRQMNGVLASIGDLVTENQSGIRQTVDSAETSMSELQASLRTINQHLSAIMHNVEGSARNMNEFARALRANPSRLIRRSSTAAEPGTQ